MKKLHTLPGDFNIGDGDQLVYFYSNDKPSVNNKVVFTQNAFCLLRHGVKEVQTASGKETVTAEDLLLLTSGSMLMSESLAANKRYEAVLIFFGNQTLLDFCARRKFQARKTPSQTSILKIRRDAYLDQFCVSLDLLRKQQQESLYELKVQEILAYVSAAFPETFQALVSQALSDKNDIRLRQVVEANQNNNLTLEELAFLCNQSVSAFKRHFAQQYGLAPQKYFNRLKMERAKSLLALQKRPSEIYLLLGYENLSAFSHGFKKHFGLSPKQFCCKIGLP